MEEKTFGAAIDEIEAYFERTKSVGERTFNLFYERVKHIPGEAVPWIVGQIKELDAWPRNLPNVFISFWGAWLKANPDRRTREHEGCDNCDRGFLILSKPAPKGHAFAGQLYDTSVRCRCNGGQCRSDHLIFLGYRKPIKGPYRPYHKQFPYSGWIPPERTHVTRRVVQEMEAKADSDLLV